MHEWVDLAQANNNLVIIVFITDTLHLEPTFQSKIMEDSQLRTLSVEQVLLIFIAKSFCCPFGRASKEYERKFDEYEVILAI